MVWREDHGIGNKAVFMALHGTDHSSLRCSWLIVVYNADAAQQLHVAKESVKMSRSTSLLEAHRHRNSHVVSCDGIHGTTDKRRLEEDVSGNATFCDDLVGSKIDFARKDKEVVVREAAMKG